MSERCIKAALLGLGTVGTGVYKVLKNQEPEMVSKLGAKVQIKKIMVRNLEKAAAKVDDPSVLTNSWKEIVEDPEIEIVIELIGGMEPESAALCFQMVMWITIVKPVFWVFAFIIPYGLRAAGDVKFTMLTSCTIMWVVRVALCIFLIRVLHFGTMAVWIAMFTDWFVRAVLYTWRFLSGKWAEHNVLG